jgi:hypothetical protein
MQKYPDKEGTDWQLFNIEHSAKVHAERNAY